METERDGACTSCGPAVSPTWTWFSDIWEVVEHSRESSHRGHAVSFTDKILRHGETETERLRVGEESEPGLEPRSVALVRDGSCNSNFVYMRSWRYLVLGNWGVGGYCVQLCVPQSPLGTCHPGVTYSQLLHG